MTWQRNMGKLDDGIFRSLNGASDEQIFIGRATKAGFFLFFKVWRDNPYDVILDNKGTLFRIEVKGFSNNTVNVTRGGRSGVQIDRAVDKTRIISREDCDFVVAIDSNKGDCYIIPVDVIEIMNQQNLTLNLFETFKEKWELFMGGSGLLPLEMIRKGLMSESDPFIDRIASSMGISPLMPGFVSKVRGSRKVFNPTDNRNYKIFRIWTEM